MSFKMLDHDTGILNGKKVRVCPNLRKTEPTVPIDRIVNQHAELKRNKNEKCRLCIGGLVFG